jgi:hypothetical protein
MGLILQGAQSWVEFNFLGRVNQLAVHRSKVLNRGMRPYRLRHSLIRVGHRTRSRKVAGLQLSYSKPLRRL